MLKRHFQNIASNLKIWHENVKLFSIILIILFFISGKSVAQFGNVGSKVMGMGKQMGSSTPSKKSSIKKPKIKKDTLSVIFPDSLKSKDSQLETTVETYSADSTVLDVPAKIYELFGDAQVTYGDIQLKANYIKLDWSKNEVFAFGSPDSTKNGETRIKGKPVFIDRSEEYNSDTIRYNFKSKKAIVSNIVTVQGDGFVQGAKVKKDPQDNMYLSNAKYTTCNLAEPHFHISSNKIKLVNKKSLVSGPFNVVIGDVPLPIGLPFGIFPIPKKKEIGTSGFVMGEYGEDPNFRGYYFRNFGYYHAFNEYIGAKLLAQLYTNGSWGLIAQSNYTKKYKYNGNFSVQFNNNNTGQVINKTSTQDFNVTWSHSPLSLRPDRSFSASVNAASNGFNKNNSSLTNVNAYTKNAMSSSMQLTRNFGKYIRTSWALRGDQNVVTRVYNASGNYNIGINQLNPFVPEKKQVGNWYESFRVGMDITGSYAINNSVTSRSTVFTDYNLAGVYNKPYTSDEQKQIAYLNAQLLNRTLADSTRALYQAQLNKLQPTVISDFNEVLKRAQFTTSYSVPIVLPNIKIAKYLNLTPSINYRGDVYAKQLKYYFLNPLAGQSASKTLSDGRTIIVTTAPKGTIPSDSVRIVYAKNDGSKTWNTMTETVGYNSGGVVVADTVKSFATAQNVSFGASLNTRIYGLYRFGPNSRIQAIRHTISPSIGFSFTPSNEHSGYATRQIVRAYNDNNNVPQEPVQKYLPKFVGGANTNPSKAMNISYSISNQLEAKVRSKSDTAAQEFTKVSILDNFGISGGVNPLAKSANYQTVFSNVNFNAATNLFKGLVNINGSTTLDPYEYSKDTVVTSNLAGIRSYTDFKKLGWSKQGASWFTSYNLSASTRLSPKTFNKQIDKNAKSTDPAVQAMNKFVRANPMDYVDFSIPWSMNLTYTINYNRQGLQARKYDPLIPSSINNAQSLISQAISFNSDVSLTPKTKITLSSGWDFRYKAVTLTSISIMRELHCWDMSFSWTPIYGNNVQTSNYSFTLKPRSALLSDMKLSRRRYNNTNGGF